MADPATVPVWVPIASALGGGALVAIINLFNNWQNKRFEERKHHKELMLNVALEQWKQASAIFIEQLKLGKASSLVPLEAYIIHMTKLSEVLNQSSITKENISRKLNEAHEVSAEIESFYREEAKREKERVAQAKMESGSE
jgi:predicted RNA-binding protein associated with RNAse of E/G family